MEKRLANYRFSTVKFSSFKYTCIHTYVVLHNIYAVPWLSAAFFVGNNNHFINYEKDTKSVMLIHSFVDYLAWLPPVCLFAKKMKIIWCGGQSTISAITGEYYGLF